MKLIKRTTLHYQAGNSDKIYEVDLCDLGNEQYIVNFRYGRRGKTLKESSKTAQPVALAKAQQVFDQLVGSKLKKGYQDVTEASSSQTQQEVNDLNTSNLTTSNVVTKDPRHQAILNAIAFGTAEPNANPDSSKGSSKWSQTRAIWRAGELKIREATPLIIPLIGTEQPLKDYCIAWALGWCGDQHVIPHLQRLYETPSTPDFVKGIAWEAWMKLCDQSTQERLRSQQIEQLPAQLQSHIETDNPAEFSNALLTYLDSNDYTRFGVLDTLYQINNAQVRPALLNLLRTAPLRPNYFKAIRHIFKIAEYRQDAQVFGIIAYRLDTEPPMFHQSYWHKYYWDRNSRKYIPRSNYLGSPDAKRAYSNVTRDYLRRRVWRTLRKLGEECDWNYINLALEVLLQYSDSDGVPARTSTLYRWNYSNWTRTSYTRNWDSYAGYLTFNHILYTNSPRYQLMPNSQAWRCRDNYKPGDPEPDVREEAFPKLWEQHPDALLQLLLESHCHQVHQFAAKALKVCQSFCNQIDTETVIRLVNKPYPVTAQLGFELATQKYNSDNPDNPNLDLLLALANCQFPPARTQAHQWIQAIPTHLITASNLIIPLVISQHSDTRTFARQLLTQSIISEATAKVLIGRVIVAVLELEPTQTDIAKDTAQTLLLGFTPQLRTLGMGVVLDLLQHPMPEIQELGARILFNHETPAADLPPKLIESLLNASHQSVQGIGVQIFGQLPDQRLLQDYDLVLAIATNQQAHLRQGIRPVIQRLGQLYPEFVTQLATEIITLLQLPERHQGVHKDLVQLLREDLPSWMTSITKDNAMELLQAKSSAAQELVGLVLQANYTTWGLELETPDIVKLANHEILSVRQAAWTMIEQRLNRIRSNSQDMLAAVRLLEAKWQDSREFATKLFSQQITEQDWTPEVMVSICDSTRDDVRQFGRDLVLRTFQQSYGQDYLLKFSEHPSQDMQLFATNYLEQYAVDNTDRLQDLIPYFISILSRVNRGRIAKQRVFAFLEAEAQKSQAAAKIVAEILTRQSITMAIGDKARSIQIMLQIHQNYPTIPLPIHVKPVSEVRGL
ncbi:WGR domain-containing protein [Moorena producens]|uniref:WGR domain-containing protein n=1 Tax=Moorena producens TaxID=1155739 RepID=UPI003C70AC24